MGNYKKVKRLRRQEGLRVPRRHRRERIDTSPAPPLDPTALNAWWGVDLSFDADERGRPIAFLSIVDEHTRECLGGVVERQITSTDVIALLDRLVAEPVAPPACAWGNGPEFASRALADWADGHVGLNYIPPGSPWCNGCVGSFNASPRDGCSNIDAFYFPFHAQMVIANWKCEYIEIDEDRLRLADRIRAVTDQPDCLNAPYQVEKEPGAGHIFREIGAVHGTIPQRFGAQR